ncbi:MAG: hypothetical protein K0Q59_4410 [Paenibacillus sp.]|jgi:AraC-like DNA-binding protein|nr:hypothetical protein [Paenibacillus sp.]
MEIDHIACHYRMEAGKLLSRWSQTAYHIFILAVKGSFIYTIGEHTFRLRKGEGLFIPQQTMRTGRTDDVPGPHQMFITYFRGVPEADMEPFVQEPYRIFQFTSQYEHLHQRFSVLNEAWIGKLPGYRLISRGIILEMLGTLQRELAGAAHSQAQRNLTMRVQQYIVQHYREPLRLDELAKEADRSPAYVSTVFKEVTGRSPLSFMHEVRVSAARELLLNTDMSVEAIAESLGYCNQTYFAQMYKKIVGHPPTHTIKSHKAAPY